MTVEQARYDRNSLRGSSPSGCRSSNGLSDGGSPLLGLARSGAAGARGRLAERKRRGRLSVARRLADAMPRRRRGVEAAARDGIRVCGFRSGHSAPSAVARLAASAKAGADAGAFMVVIDASGGCVALPGVGFPFRGSGPSARGCRLRRHRPGSCIGELVLPDEGASVRRGRGGEWRQNLRRSAARDDRFPTRGGLPRPRLAA